MNDPQVGHRVDVRLGAMKAVDVILAALQTTFQLPNLANGTNPFRYLPEDPQQSKVWISDAEGRLAGDRGGNRMLILVDRGDYTPMDLHLHNHGGGFADEKSFSDLGRTMVMVTCEGGNRVQSEQLASVVYQIIKAFRHDLMAEFDIFNLQPMSVGRATQAEGTQGAPYSTTVAIQVETQETLFITEAANSLNRMDFVRTFEANKSRTEEVAESVAFSLDTNLEDLAAGTPPA